MNEKMSLKCMITPFLHFKGKGDKFICGKKSQRKALKAVNAEQYRPLSSDAGDNVHGLSQPSARAILAESPEPVTVLLSLHKQETFHD